MCDCFLLTMQELSVAEINGLDAGFVVPAVQGKLTQIWDRKTGTHEEYGEWSIQSGVLKIGDKTIRTTFFNYPDLKRDRNKEFLIESQKGKKGFHGVYAIDNDYNNKITRELKVTEAAKMVPASDSRDEAPEQGQAAPAAEKASARPSAGQHYGADQPIEKAKRALAQVNNALYLSVVSVQKVVDVLADENYETSDENFGGMCAQAFRALDIDSLPVEPVWENKIEKSDPAAGTGDGEPLPRPETATDADNEIPF